MKPVYQTTFGDDGNCLQACVASLLEIDLESVPTVNPRCAAWVKTLEAFLAPYGLGMMWYTAGSHSYPHGYSIGMHEANGIYHATVYFEGRQVHDPLLGADSQRAVTHWIVFTCLDPSLR